MFADEFDGAVVDGSVWDLRIGERKGLGIDSYNRAQDVWLKDGNLVIRASTGMLEGKIRHFGGGLISKKGFGFGYYVVRSRPALTGSGVHSAFWQRGVSSGQYKNSIFEIDSFEIDSPHKIATNNLYVYPNSYGLPQMPWPYRSNIPLQPDQDGWIIDAFEYAPDGITYYDGGKIVAKTRYPKDFPDIVAQQNIWLTALNGVGKVSEDTHPIDTLFDYFRYYAKDYPGQNLLPNGTFEYNRDQVSPQTPVAWIESGSIQASFVVKGAPHSGASYLRHTAKTPFDVETSQQLNYIRNGNYQLSLRYRAPDKAAAASVTVKSAGRSFTAALPTTAAWRTVVIKDIAVTDQAPLVILHTRGAAGAIADFDDVELFKPSPSTRPSHPRFDPTTEPIWEIFANEPANFEGDEKFYFFDRTVGLGEAITVEMKIRADALQNALPMMRAPLKGKDGWAIGLTADGGAYCLKGSLSDNFKLSVSGVYRPGKAVTIGCAYQVGSVAIRVNGKTVKAAAAPGYATLDQTAAGRLGATVARYDALGDVTVLSDHAMPTDRALSNFVGTIADVRIWNRSVRER